MSLPDVAHNAWLVLAAIGLAFSVSYARIPVLGAGVFLSIGAFGTALLGPAGRGLPLGLAVLVSVLAAGGLGALLGRLLLAVEPAHVALFSWALAWLVYEALLGFPDQLGGAEGRTVIGPGRLSAGWQALLAGGLCALALIALARFATGPGGLDLAGMRSDRELAGALGVPVAGRFRQMLTATAVLGGVAGAGLATVGDVVSPAGISPLLSVQLFAAVVLGGAGRWWGPLAGMAVVLWIAPLASAIGAATGAGSAPVEGLLTGLLVLLALARRRRATGRTAAAAGPPRSPAATVAAPHPTSHPAGVALQADGVVVRYAGVHALEGVDVALRSGQVHGLTGRNGSGKSSLLAVLAGDLQPDAGRISVCPPSPGARRTSAADRFFTGLTVGEQVALGAQSGNREPGAALRHLLNTPRSRAELQRRAAAGAAALDTFGLTGLADLAPEALTPGQRGLLQVARVAATGAPVLLLDEPAMGMDQPQRRRLAAALRRLAGDGRAVLVVEHDRRFIAEVSDVLTVLDAGRVLSSGAPPDEGGQPGQQQTEHRPQGDRPQH